MPLLIHRSPKYRKHASGNAVVTLGGRDIYLGEHGSAPSRKEYRRLIAEWKANSGTLPASVAGGDYSIAELIAAFWGHAQVYYAPAPGKNAGELWSIKLALRVLKRLYADTDVKDFGPLALRVTRDEMLKEGWSRKYMNVQVNRLRRMFKWGVGRELVPAATWQALQAVEPLLQGKTEARETEPVGTIDDCYVDAVLPFLNRQVRAMIELQRITGMRPGELVIMRGVDLTTRNPKLWEYRPPEHKNAHRGHERIIYLNRTAQDIIRPFLKSEMSAYIFSPAEAEQERRAAKTAARKTPLSCGTRAGMKRARKPRRAPGEHYTTDSYRRAVTRACDLANEHAKGGSIVRNGERVIPRFHPHQIRHNTATKLRAEHGLEAAQVILGHRTLSAAQIYAEKNVAAAKKIMMEGA